MNTKTSNKLSGMVSAVNCIISDPNMSEIAGTFCIGVSVLSGIVGKCFLDIAKEGRKLK